MVCAKDRTAEPVAVQSLGLAIWIVEFPAGAVPAHGDRPRQRDSRARAIGGYAAKRGWLTPQHRSSQDQENAATALTGVPGGLAPRLPWKGAVEKSKIPSSAPT